MAIVISHPTGNSNVRAVISALLHAEKLAEFNTTLAINSKAQWLKLFPQTIRQELLRRTFPVSPEQLWTHPLLEIARIGLHKIGFPNSVKHEYGWASIDSVYQNFDRAVARHLVHLVNRRNVEGVYGYEDGALATFIQAKTMGIKCIYDLPIAYWETGRRLMFEEAERLPQWSSTLGGGVKDSEMKLERKTQELELADIVVGPSKFVIDSLPNWAREKTVVMSPFGSPKLSYYNKNNKSIMQIQDDTRALRVLFVGSMGQRKGLGDLFAGVKQLKGTNIELIIMGSLLAPMNFYRKEFSDFIYEPCRPHEQVLELMRTCDVFCLPSIVEGRALVMQEAMSQGLPLIITPNTGGADLIKEGQTGFIIPVRSPEAIAEKILWFVENRSAIPEMSRKAKEHAMSYTWDSYGAKIVKSILPNLEEKILA
jgi:glycosyltransferase involved in cell wall biosynthesis